MEKDEQVSANVTDMTPYRKRKEAQAEGKSKRRDRETTINEAAYHLVKAIEALESVGQ